MPSIWGKFWEVIHLIATGELYTTLKYSKVRSGKISTIITELSPQYSDVLPGGIATIIMYTPTQCKNVQSGYISMLTTSTHDRVSQTHRHVLWLG